MAEFTSTRNRNLEANAHEAVLRGIAPDGGLYVPARFSHLSAEETLSLPYAQIAQRVIGRMLPAFEGAEIKTCCEKVYPARFADARVCPLRRAGDDYVLELFHGETAAFKDIALSLLPLLSQRARKALGVQDKILILTATSGDTGSAAMNGFQGAPGAGILVFYPLGGVSEIQLRQMISMKGDNVCVCAVEGNFDDCQTAVKRAFTGLTPPRGIRFSSANSINIARLVPQIAYYYAAYADLVNMGAISMGKPVDFIVPTGNFGDILAGYYAKQMGLPVGKLVCASNANRVLADFIETGVYDRRRSFAKTLSPSMDILISSNLERLLYHAQGGDCALVAAQMNALREEGVYRVSEDALKRIQSDFRAYGKSDEETLRQIARVFRETGYLPDPHTAVGFAAMEAHKKENPGAVCVVLATASPFKFPESALTALGERVPEGAFRQLDALAARARLSPPESIRALEHARARFTDHIAIHQVQDYILGKAETLCQR